MHKNNLSNWALTHQNLVLFIMVAVLVLGIFGYSKLGQSENPPFTFKVMVIQVQWPGATALEIEDQVVNRIEKVVMESPYVDTLKSYSQPGAATITVIGEDKTHPSKVPDLFYQVRKRVQDITYTLPQGVIGPFFNDEFGDTFGNIYALTGDGFSMGQLRDAADEIRKELLRVPDVTKVLLIGEQPERVYIQLDNDKAAQLGITLQQLQTQLSNQNAMVANGVYNTQTDRISVYAQGRFQNLSDVKVVPVRVGDRTVRLEEIATITRDYVDPPANSMRFMGRPALGIGISMKSGGDIIKLGQNLSTTFQRLSNQLPVGMDLRRVNDQPTVVKVAIREFLQVVFEAVVIVLAVSFFSLGVRAGTVVALSIPLVLAGTFFVMFLFDVGLHQISLGALILALGLLVDDAIIAVEMMALKLEQGMDRVKAASFAYETTAFPMLTGTFVTIAGFLPIATAQSATGEYTRAIFQVVTIALVLSWFAAVILVPYLGYHLLKEEHHQEKTGILGSIGRVKDGIANAFTRFFKGIISLCVRFPLTVILLTLLSFGISIAGFKLVQQQFFPEATRLELLVDLKLPEGSSQAATQREVEKVEEFLSEKLEHISNFAVYVGTGSPRFYLPLDQQLPNPSFAQFVITTKSIEHREALRTQLIELIDSEQFSQLRGRVLRLENGPPVGYPVQFRIVGSDLWVLRGLAEEVANLMRVNPNMRNVHLDWNELRKTIHLKIDQEKAIGLGISQATINQTIYGVLQGIQVGEFRERDQTIPILLRGGDNERKQLDLLLTFNIPTATGSYVPLGQIAEIVETQEESIIWHRDRTPTITVRGDIYTKVQAPTVTNEILSRMDEFKAKLPLGYELQVGGAVEESAKGSTSIAAGVPLFIGVVLTLLMLQLQSFQRVIMVVLTAPFGIIGVVIFLLAFNKPFGFVAMLGTIALSGMIMRNSVILVDQIDRHIEQGMIPKEAVITSAVTRFRPIMLTALAAILAMIPLSRSVFFGPMAVAIMGGLLVATLLTLFFLPALYTVWYKLVYGRQQFFGNATASIFNTAPASANGTSTQTNGSGGYH